MQKVEKKPPMPTVRGQFVGSIVEIPRGWTIVEVEYRGQVATFAVSPDSITLCYDGSGSWWELASPIVDSLAKMRLREKRSSKCPS